MKPRKNLRAGLIVLPACVIGAARAQADIVYRETFSHNSATDPGTTPFDWATHGGTGVWQNSGSLTNGASVNGTSGRNVTTYNPDGSSTGVVGCNSRDDALLSVNAGFPGSSYLY